MITQIHIGTAIQPGTPFDAAKPWRQPPNWGRTKSRTRSSNIHFQQCVLTQQIIGCAGRLGSSAWEILTSA